jgi:hypothetical protein
MFNTNEQDKSGADGWNRIDEPVIYRHNSDSMETTISFYQKSWICITRFTISEKMMVVQQLWVYVHGRAFCYY